ncbi:CDP-diacylglycerol--glycerol-3-phosphate 3-phosphatidyltransferase [Salinarchaeum sp. Harcht-Bsk1]|uniref:CDP-alcohol phosphatidyltransferase family protein n=1 Tax=Salinarchaeum sp. Harcht-Bsk1 TaxID=1333523 RepID=UPI0003423E5E|nr:CDP-alcohol phosphatidyltransferase family protein [Salinarchaeum sp. Harcht-Bsk1]AGN02119.1 CDP-diacylglycerol--glycerol-3-phosphate 3-phosphatidyltransferase [Salinarchaeum sp. Harcht-Bsk1]
MTLDRLRPLADKGLSPWVGLAARLGLTPNGVSLIAFAVAVAAGATFVVAGAEPLYYVVGGVLVGLSGWLDIVDGALARKLDVASAKGDLLDHVLDRYADIVLIAGLAAGIERYAIGFAAVTGVVMTSYMGTQIQAVGLGREYGGLIGRADRMVLIGVVATATTVYPDAVESLTLVGWLLVFFAIVGHFTAVQRFYGAWADVE